MPCPNCIRFFVRDCSVYAPKRRNLASMMRNRTYYLYCGYVFTGDVRFRRRLSKDEWLRIVMESTDPNLRLKSQGPDSNRGKADLQSAA